MRQRRGLGGSVASVLFVLFVVSSSWREDFWV